MNIRLDPVNEEGTFDNELYISEDYKDLYNTALKYIKLEGFHEVAGTYDMCISGQYWVLKVS